ncbi:MAG TPA: ATP synthase F1 subunit delta, partial [Chitinophagaceae bacterium]
MPNPRLAGRYAKSLIDLATERSQLEVVYKDALYLQALCKASREFVVILRSPVIKADKKLKIVAAVTDGKVGELMTAFIRLLINKTREANLPEIINATIDQYNTLKGIHKVKLTTAEAVSDTLKESITANIKQET